MQWLQDTHHSSVDKLNNVRREQKERISES